jgi:quercetin dioxygenase-like cupin family protein
VVQGGVGLESGPVSDRFEDHRGVIQDWFDGRPIDAVTHIVTAKGAIRGNHVHRETVQWTLVLTGRLLMATGGSEVEAGPGTLTAHHPGDPHAWKALEDTDCLVFTRGPRAGENYEQDTYRLEEPLLS